MASFPLLSALSRTTRPLLFKLFVRSLYSFRVSQVLARNVESDVLVQLRFLQGNSFISLSCVGVWLWRTSIRYGSAAFILLLITLVVPPIFCYRFQPASLASLLFINFQFRFILVVGSLLSPLDSCEHAKKKCADTQRECVEQ